MRLVKVKILLLFLVVISVYSKQINSGYYAHEVVKTDTITEGLIYKHIKIGKRETRHSVRLIECDLTNPNLSPIVLKAKDNNYSTEKIHDMIARYDSIALQSDSLNSYVPAAINANFWRAYSLYPIGPTVVDGEIVEKYRYKKWSSIFFDSTGTPYIDAFDIKITMFFNKDSLEIHRVNRRYDTTKACLYNHFYGEQLPRVLDREISKAYKEELEVALSDTLYQDSTEVDFDSLLFKQQLIETAREENFEFPCLKIVLEYLDSPAINKTTECIVTIIDTGSVEIPKHGCVISLGKMHQDSINLKIGDIVYLKKETNQHSDVVFYNSVCGTPRLVRRGNANHEAYAEGSTGRRFISRRLTRTAVGYNKEKTKLYLVICNSTSKTLSRKGADLSDMAAIMKSLGCYDAINLDGGGSTYMVNNYVNVSFKSNPRRGRKVSVALGVKIINKKIDEEL